MVNRESKFGLLFRHWLRANPRYSCAFELKQSESESIPFACLEEHQIDYLQAIKSDKGALIRVQGVNGEPDYVYLRNFPANVVIRYKDSFHLIDIDIFLREKAAGRRGLTSERAQEVAAVSVYL